MDTFAIRLRKLRKKRKLTQVDVGDMLGVSGENVSRYERGLSYPTADKLLTLSKNFQVSMNYLLADDDIDIAAADMDDVELLNFFLKVRYLSNDDKKTIKNVLRSFTEK